MNCCFLLPNLKEQQKSGRSPFTVPEYLFYFQSYNGLKMSSFGSKSGKKILSKSIKINRFVTSCALHVDGMKKNR